MRILILCLVAAALIISALLLSVAHAPQTGVPAQARDNTAVIPAGTEVLAISFVRARPGQRERLERFLKSNWLALDELALQQHKITSFRMLRADPDPKESSWDFAVMIEYPDRQAMADFVPFYLDLARARPHVRVDGLDFADLGEVMQQKVVEPVDGAGAAPEVIGGQAP